MSTEIESLAVPLIGALPQSITDQPVVLIIYVLLVVALGAALASVVLRSVLYAIAAFAITMAAVAFLYLMLAPFLLFAVQLLIFTTVSAGLLIGLLRTTTRLEEAPASPFSPELMGGAAIAAAVAALLGVVVGATNWPVRFTGGLMEGFGHALANTYIVGIAVLVVTVASAALGAGLLATQRLGRRAAATLPPTTRQGRQRPRPPESRG
ncbi:MAG: hypothetical protein M3077_02475 [Candidatus Dormibacteraeota bacterium]|nr:hypothetical protein [Candidatus Dormibacteraeota bacterium]